MANLYVLAFQDEDGAARTRKAIKDLQKEELIDLDDAAIAVHHETGKVKVKQDSSLTGSGAVGGAFWGLLFGLIFFIPFAGMAIGAMSGAMFGTFAHYGIDEDMIKKITKKLGPGTSALFLLVNSAQREKVIEALRPYDAELIQSSLSSKQEAELKEALVA
jgi:uncharacterized membrane protein